MESKEKWGAPGVPAPPPYNIYGHWDIYCGPLLEECKWNSDKETKIQAKQQQHWPGQRKEETLDTEYSGQSVQRQELVNEESLCKTFTTYIIKWLTSFISLNLILQIINLKKKQMFVGEGCPRDSSWSSPFSMLNSAINIKYYDCRGYNGKLKKLLILFSINLNS